MKKRIVSPTVSCRVLVVVEDVLEGRIESHEIALDCSEDLARRLALDLKRRGDRMMRMFLDTPHNKIWDWSRPPSSAPAVPKRRKP